MLLPCRVSRTRALLSFLVAVALGSACNRPSACQGISTQRISDSANVVTRAFLTAAADGESARLAIVATDSMVARVGVYQRNNALFPLSDAARTYQIERVEVDGCEALVWFRYESTDHVLHALAETEVNDSGMQVKNLHMMVER